MVGFALASGVGQLGVVGQPEQIGIGEGTGIEGDVMDGVVGEKECDVRSFHVIPFWIYVVCCPHPDPLLQGEGVNMSICSALEKFGSLASCPDVIKVSTTYGTLADLSEAHKTVFIASGKRTYYLFTTTDMIIMRKS